MWVITPVGVQQIKIMSKSNKQKETATTRFGVYYRSHGNWTGPYAGKTFTRYSLSRRPISADLSWIKNRVLKSRIKIMPVNVVA